jgi:TolB protein
VRLSFSSVVGALVVFAGVVGLLSTAAVAGGGESLALGSDSPSWSPDGQMLAFVGFRAGRPGDIYVIRRNGKGERRVTTTSSHEDTPRWSHDGRKLAFVRHVGLVRHLFVMNADGTGQRQLTFGSEPSFAPTWSPDDTRIAFARGRDTVVGSDSLNPDDPAAPGPSHAGDPAEIYVVNADGSAETRLTRNAAIDTQPAWSPDGNLIAFTSDRAGTGAQHIFLMRPDGSEPRKLTNNPITFQNELRPAWSPDGSTIAFVSEREIPVGNNELYAVGADGLDARRLTWNTFHDDWPTWAPDGELAIARGRNSFRPEIFVMSADGSLARKVTGKNLRFVGLTRSPTEPRAARAFALELAVRPAVDPFTDIECSATLADQLLPETAPRLISGRVRCSWRLPRSARGKLLRAVIFAGAGGSEISRTVTRVVR